ncbi:MAG: ThiF family adenylyltransferase [Candidatus Izemoplasmatales bacterium]|jgi:tRNA A37 threonylcarbamoyladenosine dehydratase|nr:ThiF family adenylyltransferase [Candidatus Izemoplasmatales bacterium]MDD4354764.1 ThiF family adenylyltransferase [Candidatus Izemoplasmatales bacterium]MDD4987962.1 ThiF family adenylyltransferase [Candidatus Izemoplasmatales bacterium]NLF48212.1 tRNA threonylcarbamoyladenosine dehydratase [Acholeplasmataceae bacterium]
MRYQRLEAMIGKQKRTLLQKKKVLVLGLGGVGSYAVEALARSGVGRLILVDPDVIDITNINRQLEALTSTVGKQKTDVYRERIHAIDPDIFVDIYTEKLSFSNLDQFLALSPDWIIDAIDDIPAKCALMEAAGAKKQNFISSMGFANKLKPEAIRIAKMRDTFMCPMAKAIRHELNKRQVSLDFPVVFSTEKPLVSQNEAVDLGSVSFVPAVAGLMMASVVIRALIDWEEKE